MELPLDRLAAEVAGIARRAGKAILEIYHQPDAEWGVEKKSDSSPLTRADLAANAVICEDLEALQPALPIVSEENRTVPYEQRREYEYYWLVDPLDGTKDFIKRNGEFTVNIALIHRHRPIMGVVYAPEPAELFVGYEKTAFRQKGGQREAIEADAFSLKDPGLTIVCSRNHLNEATRNYMAQFDAPQTISVGSSLKFLMVAAGRAQLYPRLGPTSEWDTAAAQAVVEAAGGRVLQLETGEPLRYNKENLLNPHFIVYGRLQD